MRHDDLTDLGKGGSVTSATGNYSSRGRDGASSAAAVATVPGGTTTTTAITTVSGGHIRVAVRGNRSLREVDLRDIIAIMFHDLGVPILGIDSVALLPRGDPAGARAREVHLGAAAAPAAEVRHHGAALDAGPGQDLDVGVGVLLGLDVAQAGARRHRHVPGPVRVDQEHVGPRHLRPLPDPDPGVRRRRPQLDVDVPAARAGRRRGHPYAVADVGCGAVLRGGCGCHGAVSEHGCGLRVVSLPLV